MDFWHSIEVLLKRKDANLGPKIYGYDSVGSQADGFLKNNNSELDMGTNKEQQHPGNDHELAIRSYALRFLKYNSSSVPSRQADAPATPDRISDPGIMDSSWDEHLTEKSLFYAVPSGAIETYRRYIESYSVQTEKTDSNVQEEVETSVYDAGAGFGYGDFVYDKDEVETSMYLLPGAFEGSKSSKLNQKRQTNSLKIMKSYPARSYDVGAGLPYGNCAQQSTLIAAAGVFQAPTKTDASSGDTNSFQDDQSTLNGGFLIQKSMEVELTGEFERKLPYNCAEESTKPKMKKKNTNLGSAYDEGWQLESTHNELGDYSKKRPESFHFDSNGTSGLHGQHKAKRLKIMKQTA